MSLNKVNEHERVIVDFYADWCAPCKTTGSILETLEKENLFYVIKVDIEEEENAEVIKKFGVRSIPTLIAYQHGEEVGKYVGAMNKEQILALFE